MTGCDTGTGPS